MEMITFITVLIGFIAIIGSNIGLFLWNRSESRNDIRAMENRTFALLEGINKEMKDFHGRLCSLEGRWHQMPSKETQEKK